MKKVVALLGIIFIASAITYFSFDWSGKDITSENVLLTDGSTIGLVPEEIALGVKEGEREVIITDLGMV
jgi:hypothetical protein